MERKIFALFFVFALFLLVFPSLALADDRCPDYCADVIFYSGRTYNTRSETCSDPTNRQTCDYGCDGRDKCAGRPETPTVTPTSVPTAVPPTTVPTAASRPTLYVSPVPIIKILNTCSDKCEAGTFYSGGKYDAEKARCQYDLVEKCFSGKCDRDSKKCAKKEEAPTCDNYCKGDIKYFEGTPNAQGTCVFKQEICGGGCSEINKNDCNPFFEIGPAYFTDPYDNILKSIPEATVEMMWIFDDASLKGQTVVKPLPERQTNIDGTINVLKSELYQHLDNETAYLAIKVELKDFNKRFQIMDNANGNQVPFLQKNIYVSDPKTYKIDFNFDTTQADRRNAKMYYHIWEAVNFSEKVLGTKIDYLPPESVSFNNPQCSGGCHSSAMGVLAAPSDNGIFYNASVSKLADSNSPENLEWHEFCHHIMADEFGFMVPWVPPCGCINSSGKITCNHCGYPNFDSGDSWLEGWAEFCALAVKDYYKYPNPSVYSTFGNLEVNFGVKYNEEFAVASALWDLYDKEPQPGSGKKVYPSDGVQLSIQQIWNVLKGQYTFPGEKTARHIYNFSDIYWAFNQSNLSGLKDKNNLKKKNSGTDNLDAIFIARGCYGDTNNNNKWDLSEPVGYTFKPAGSTTVRPNRPPKPGAYLKISLKGNNNKEIQGTKAQIKVTFQNDSCGLDEDCDYEYWAPIEDGKVYLEPPTADFDATVEIAVFSGEKSLALAKFTAKDYWQKYDAKKPFVQSYELKVDNFQNIPATQLFLTDVIAKAAQENVAVKSSELAGSVYKISGLKSVKLLRIIPVKMKVAMEIDSQTGNILKLQKPWWSFLAF